jgi:alanyl-tRNA synthetase
MEEQRVRARKAREALGDLAWAGIDLGLDTTPTEFTGYDRAADTGKVLAIVADGELRDEMVKGVDGMLVLDKTPFYAEMGGQTADHGTIRLGDAVFTVTNVQKTRQASSSMSAP